MVQRVFKYLRHLNIPVSKGYFEKLILSHPEYPSLLSIADALEGLGIDYEAVRIPQKELVQVTPPYLLKLGGKAIDFIENKQDLAIHINSNGDNEYAIIFRAKAASTIANKENNIQRSEENFRKILMWILVPTVLGFILLHSNILSSWFYIFLLFTILGGIGIGYLLIAKDLGLNYQSIEALCQANKRTNCDVVLNSFDAKKLGGITLSDVTASYFLFQLIVVSFLLQSSDGGSSYLVILLGLCFFTVPIIAYSLYFQFLKLKTWCGLCLVVDAILIIQAVLFGYMYFIDMISIADVDMLTLLIALLLLSTVFLTLSLLKNIIKTYNKSSRTVIAANRIKHTPDVFKQVLFQRKRVDIIPFNQELLIGSQGAPIEIHMAAMLGCVPCGKEFQKAAHLVLMYPDKVKLVIRFQFMLRQDTDISRIKREYLYLLSYWQRYIYGKKNESEATFKLLNDWYTLKNFSKFKMKYSLEGGSFNDYLTRSLAVKHTEWIEKLEIIRFPTFFINGYWYPRDYSMEDMVALMPSILAHSVNGNIQIQHETASG